MTRPKKCRRIAFMPGVNYFKPAGIPMRFLDEVRLTFEETESIRLKDIEGLDQQQCATMMNISRPTFQRVLGSARKKIAGALLTAKPSALRAVIMRWPGTPAVVKITAIRPARKIKWR
jgi:uncharacterized protein